MSLGKYLAIATTAGRHALSQKSEIVGRGILYFVILTVFSRLWEAVSGEVDSIDISSRELLWYLFATEWVVLSIPLIHLDIESDIRSGEIAYRLPRPVSYVGARLAEGLGTLFVRLFCLGLIGGSATWWLAGGLPPRPESLLVLLPVGAVAATIAMGIHVLIGLGAVWFTDIAPIYWVWQKLMFVLGGLMFPLDIYPDWLRSIAIWTPFHPLLYGTARTVLEVDGFELISNFARLLGWGVVLALVMALLYRRALRVLDLGGG